MTMEMASSPEAKVSIESRGRTLSYVVSESIKNRFRYSRGRPNFRGRPGSAKC